jgi:hypothetical protein
MKTISFGILGAALILWTASGCGPSSSDGGQFDAGDGDAVNNHLQQDAGQWDAGQLDAPPATPKIVYAHTDTTLFQGDPTASPLTLTQIGDFDCIGSGTGQDPSMTDVAVDKDGNLYAISNTAMYPLEISGSTVHCVATHALPSGAHFYGLTFAPAGVLRSTEMLVAANSAGELWAIDEQGATTQVGTFGTVPANDGHGHTYTNAGKDWELSGDIVFLENGGNWVGFATLRDCPTPPYSSNCNTVDTLVEIDLTKLALNNTTSVTKAVKGQVVKSSTCSDTANTGYGSMYGITAWQAKVFGFSRQGYLVEINNSDGTACLVKDYTPSKFAGAGITTSAPVILE